MFQGAIVTPNSLIVNIDNKVYNAQSNHPNFKQLKEAYKAGDTNAFVEAFDVKEAVRTYVENGERKSTGVEIVGDQVLYNGQPVHNKVVETIQNMMSEGFDIKPMVKFLENMMKNPSYNSVKEMWKFIESMGLAITEDGCFLAYKTVREDYKDKYTGTIDNTPGQNPPRLERNQVDDNCNNACSHGYHVGALGYAGPGGWYNSHSDKVLICKVNPADVVSVPLDYSCQKMRCTYYEPVGDFKEEVKGPVYSGRVGDDYTYTPPCSRFEPEIVYNDEILEGNCYIGLYTKKDGSTSTRYFLIDEVRESDYVVELLEPEQCAGEYRIFRMDGLQEVRTWDGETDPSDLINPWDEEEEDRCEYCGECDCDGYCDEEDENEGDSYSSYW